MDLSILNHFLRLSTPLVADACLRLKLPVRFAPPGIHSVLPGHKIIGPVLPVKHFGSVDIFLEAMELAKSNQVLVIDNSGRMDEGCIGDLIVMEAKCCGLSGIVIWGAHRDTSALKRIDFPVFSYGSCPFGPRRLVKHDECDLPFSRIPDFIQVGDCKICKGDVVFGDDDGVIFFPGSSIEELLNVARSIYHTECKQVQNIKSGKTLREQLQLQLYLSQKFKDPTYTFRKHLRAIGKAIEE